MSANTVAEPGQRDGLLDIHQAAAFLNVSEVSIRRYTNSGKLNCLRVGGRNERRFRREDLEQFIGAEVQKAPSAAIAPCDGRQRTETHPHVMQLDGMDVPWGSHLCQLYESDRGRLQMSVPFLADGLNNGDACFLVASDAECTQILNALAKSRRELDQDIEAGHLKMMDCCSSGKQMMTALDDAFGTALENGYSRLRLVGDMAWFRDQGMSTEELVDFETRYDLQIGHSYPIVSLCLYDARRFSGVDILHALKSHSDTFQLPLSRFLLR